MKAAQQRALLNKPKVAQKAAHSFVSPVFVAVLVDSGAAMVA